MEEPTSEAPADGAAEPSSMNSLKFMEPHRAINNPVDLKAFHDSKTYADVLGFVRAGSDAVRGRSATAEGDYVVSPSVQCIVDMMEAMLGWVDEIPSIQQPMRFGNKAFRTWHERLVDEAPAMMVKLLPEDLIVKGASKELLPYFTTSFGHPQRIDYGTGHETNFIVWLLCLRKLRVLGLEDVCAAVLRGFGAYLRTMRKLQTEYMLEPAGSHGVWGLDDYHCLPFLFGSAQLIDNPELTPASVHDEDLLAKYAEAQLYFGAIRHIKSLKQGAPFGECCPMLNDISALPSWRKVNAGMFRLYEGEVLGKMPVIQHFLFGSLLPCTWDANFVDRRRIPSPPPPPGGFDPFVSAQAPWAVGAGIAGIPAGMSSPVIHVAPPAVPPRPRSSSSSGDEKPITDLPVKEL